MNRKRTITSAVKSILIFMVLVGGLGFTLASGSSSALACEFDPYLVKDIIPGSGGSSLLTGY